MPFKLQSKGRRHIPRQRHRVTNWREYDASLRNRGSLTIWFPDDAVGELVSRGSVGRLESDPMTVVARAQASLRISVSRMSKRLPRLFLTFPKLRGS